MSKLSKEVLACNSPEEENALMRCVSHTDLIAEYIGMVKDRQGADLGSKVVVKMPDIMARLFDPLPDSAGGSARGDAEQTSEAGVEEMPSHSIEQFRDPNYGTMVDSVDIVDVAKATGFVETDTTMTAAEKNEAEKIPDPSKTKRRRRRKKKAGNK